MPRLTLLLAVLLSACPSAEEPLPELEGPPDCSAAPPGAWTLNDFGGIEQIQLPATGFYRIEELGGRWWFVDPDGHPLLSQAVNHVTHRGDRDIETDEWPYGQAVEALYADEAAWADIAVVRLRQWGFHGLGAWRASSELQGRMPETPILGLGGVDWIDGTIADVFADGWATAVQDKALQEVEGRVDDPLVIGWFLDNEMRWGVDWRGTEDLTELSWELGPDTATQDELLAFFRARYDDDFAAFAASWQVDGLASDWAGLEQLASLPDGGEEDRRAWEEHYADRYFAVTSGSVRAVDPNHLLLGVRFISQMIPSPVVRASGRHLDVVSVNRYELTEGLEDLLQNASPEFARTGDDLEEFHLLSGRPILISEFGYRAMDSGLPNSSPPIQLVLDTQTERAEHFAAFAHRHLAPPWGVGLHWFEWTDEPPGGRFDGENSNWGLVSLEDEPYAELVAVTATEGVVWAYDCWAPELESAVAE